MKNHLSNAEIAESTHNYLRIHTTPSSSQNQVYSVHCHQCNTSWKILLILLAFIYRCLSSILVVKTRNCFSALVHKTLEEWPFGTRSGAIACKSNLYTYQIQWWPWIISVIIWPSSLPIADSCEQEEWARYYSKRLPSGRNNYSSNWKETNWGRK